MTKIAKDSKSACAGSRVGRGDPKLGTPTDGPPRDILKAVFESISALIREPTLGEAASAALRAVGEVFDVDRCVVLEFVEHAGGSSDLIPRYQWTRSGIQTLPREIVAKGLGNPDIAAWQAPLREGKPVITTTDNANPTVRALLRELGLVSILLVPITVGGKYWGQIGLDDRKSGRIWTPPEIDTLLALAALFGMAIVRGRLDSELAVANAIIRRSPTIFYRVAAAEPGQPLTFVSANVELLGYKPSKLLEDAGFYHTLVHPDDRARVEKMQAQSLGPEAGPTIYEFRMRRADGTYRWFEVHRTPVRDANGKVIAFEGELRDIDERKCAEERLALSNALLTSATENSPDGILIVDPQQTILAFNRHFVELWNAPVEALNARDGKLLLQFISGRVKDPAGFVARAAHIRDHPTEATYDEIELADGRIFERHSGTLYGEDRTKPLGLIFFFRDITERRRIEEGRERANRALRMMNVCDNIIIHATDEERLLTDLCQAMVDIGGYKLAWIGLAQDDAERTVRPIAWAGYDREYVDRAHITWANDERGRGPTGTAIRTGHIAIVRDMTTDPNFGPWREAAAKCGYRSSAALPLKMGSRISGSLTVYATAPNMFDLEEGELLTDLAADIGYAMDALHAKSARVAAEEALRRSEEKFRGLVESTSDYLWEVNGNGQYTYVSPRAKDMLGYEPAELIGKTPFDFMPAEERERVSAAYNEHVASRRPFSLLRNVELHKDGHPVVLETSGVPIVNPNGAFQGYRGIDRDITAQVEAEKKLAYSNVVLTATTENSPDAILVVDDQARIISSNGRFAELFKVPPALIEARVDEPVLQHVISRVKNPDEFLARVRHLYEHPDEIGHDEMELVDGRIIDRHTTALRKAGGEYIGRIWFFRDITERRESERKLRGSEERFRTIFESVNDVIMLHDPQTLAVLDVNRRIFELTGYTREEFLRLGLSALWADKSQGAHDEARRRLQIAARSDQPQIFEWQILTRDGRRIWVEVTLRRAEFMGQTLLLSTTRDITERKVGETKLRDSEERFRTIFESVSDIVMLHDVNMPLTVVDANPRAHERIGYSLDELRTGGLALVFGDQSQAAKDEATRLGQLAAAGVPQTFEWQVATKDGRRLWFEVMLRKVTFGGHEYLLSAARDITARKAAEHQVAQLARTDTLTALPNRRVFVEALQQAISRAERGGKGFAILYLDLDHFKDVNDTLGHFIGDELLKAVSARLLTNVRATDVVARFGGDEFAVLETDISDPDEAAALATKLLETIAHPFKIDGNQIQTGTSIGITINEPGPVDSEMLLSHADLALYRAKSEGRGTYRFFTESMDTEVHDRVRLTAELREAIAAGQFFLEYQPQVQVGTGRIVGLEALIRWRHPQRGVLTPTEFVGVAERSGLIVPIGRLVLAGAFRQMKAWVDAGIAPEFMAVNVSANQFKWPLELEQAITSILAETGLPPRRLEIELTETALMEKTPAQADVLKHLHASGIRLAIDDFGTGYSSLEYLRRLAVDRIKIAQIFIAHMVDEPSAATIVRAAISLARALSVEIIAEGVETQEQLDLVKSWHCDHVQGFYYSRPVSAEDAAALLRAGKIVPPAASGATRDTARQAPQP